MTASQLFDEALSHHQNGRPAEAERLCRAILALDAHHADALNLSGIIAYQAGQADLAVRLIRSAIRANAVVPAYHSNLGFILHSSGRFDEALAACDAAIRMKPGFADVHCNRGNTLNALGRHEEAIAACDVALCIKPDMDEALNNRGNALSALGRNEEAVALYDAAIRVEPAFSMAYSNRGNALRDLGRLSAALASYDVAIRITPNYAEALSNRGLVLNELGRFNEALASYESAVALDANLAEAHSNLILSTHYASDVGEDTIQKAVRRFAGLFEAASLSFANVPDPDRKLRIGYVSGDFGRHPVGHFLAPVLTGHDRSRTEIFCYGTSTLDDVLTARLRASANHWRNLVGLDDLAAADLIRRDGIDILVDLSGHTAHNRLPMFARRPAPIQVSWLGYWGTTGLAAMDYILSDDVTIPLGEEGRYSEQVVRLPGGRFCYSPADYAPAPVAPPSLQGGRVTFGSFNNLAKVGIDVVVLWARVLAAVPEARLLLKWKSLGEEDIRNSLLVAFAGQGIDPGRLILRGASPHAEMLAEYGDIDIALDPFPFSGGLTSCEALWQGVPVVSLPGKAAQSRQTLGFLKTLGFGDWAAADAGAYVGIAARLAADPDLLTELRGQLRSRMSASTLCDGPAFTRGLEAVFRTIWRTWCTGNE